MALLMQNGAFNMTYPQRAEYYLPLLTAGVTDPNCFSSQPAISTFRHHRYGSHFPSRGSLDGRCRYAGHSGHADFGTLAKTTFGLQQEKYPDGCLTEMYASAIGSITRKKPREKSPLDPSPPLSQESQI